MSENSLFKNINKIKQRVKMELLSNQKVLKYIAYDDENPLSLPDIDDAQALINDRIYLNPIAWDKTIQEVKTFLLSNIRVATVRNSQQFADIYLYVYVISHNDIYDLEDGTTRVWNICDELMESFHNTFGKVGNEGIGKCHFRSMQEIISRKDYYAVELQFVFTEFKI